MPQEHALKSFLSRFGPFVLFVLSGFDRLRLAGASRLLNHGRGVHSYLWQQQILFKDFPAHPQQLTHPLRRRTEALAQEQGGPLLPRNSPSTDKEATALPLAPPHPGPGGRSAVLSCVESCATYRVFHAKEGAAAGAPQSWQQLRKGVADLGGRAEVSQAANGRLAESLASVAETTPLGKRLEPLRQPARDAHGRRHRALKPTAGAAGELLRCLARGEFLLNGFRNRDLRKLLCPAPTEARVRRQQAAALTRQLALLRAPGLIVKVQKTHRYRLSAEGQRVTTAVLAAYEADVNRLTGAA